MNKIIFFSLLMIGAIGCSQHKDYNTKKGYAAAGYDVVAYFDGQALEGKKEFTTNYDDVNYMFNSRANMDRFNARPEVYLPQYGGYCAYAMAVNGKKVNVDPETYEVRDGKLYLFYNKGKNNTLQLWLNESPQNLQSMADINWEKLIN
ncbi:YHS domain-containing (seleno)protein [Allomuricauda sp. F6463D]|uniref:YHS domain-containing (seleno)protein n=1 Tax=Allomuricauda sp. F6463D TaxID=2926409 RepID=UPI001FF28AA0|nr:YHS domain-containing (seleno)protein [Muricauda sp. F6463D]MCK0161828.1 YHS domain-containing protein [Muricauda sp. F6463D]